jgi:hypothetical protein
MRQRLVSEAAANAPIPLQPAIKLIELREKRSAANGRAPLDYFFRVYAISIILYILPSGPAPHISSVW